MPTEGQLVLERLLERLMAGLMNGPGLNCRPHNSRQRLDLAALAKLQDLSPSKILPALLSDAKRVKVTARVPAPVKAIAGDAPRPDDEQKDRPEQKAWLEQQAVFTKLRNVIEDGKTYEQDTGVHVLSIGFPLLRVPPNALSGPGAGASSRRILAPVAFIPVEVTIKRGVAQSIELACRGSGVDLVEPNAALLAWLDQQQKHADLPEVFNDPSGEDPWREISELVRRVCTVIGIEPPSPFAANIGSDAEEVPLQSAPRADEGERAEIVLAAVLGLYPMANQGLIEDMKALAAGEPPKGPIESFLRASASLSGGDTEPQCGVTQPSTGKPKRRMRRFEDERLVAQADPSQAKAVRMARECRGLVVHGPPGTGKSQTITNVIGDHLALGQRVLFVCDKRTALDVVFNRLKHLGLGDLCAVVHDPQRDQRDLYRAVRNQLEGLAEAKTNADAEHQLSRADAELTRLHGELTRYHAALMERQPDQRLSVHDLIGEWLAAPASPVKLDQEITKVPIDEFRAVSTSLRDLLDRARSSDYPRNPWRDAVGVSLQEYLSRSMTDIREAVRFAADAASAVDGTLVETIPPFTTDGASLEEQAVARVDLAARLDGLLAEVPAEVRSYWAGQSPASVRKASQRLDESRATLERARSKPLDFELRSTIGAAVPVISALGQNISALAEYLEIATKWYAPFCSKRKKAARDVLSAYGLQLNPDNATRAKAFVEALRDRMSLSQVYCELSARQPLPLVPDEELDAGMTHHSAAVAFINHVISTPAIAPLEVLARDAMRDDSQAGTLTEALRLSAPRASAIDTCLASLHAIGIINLEWIAGTKKDLCAGGVVSKRAQSLADALDQLENVVRVREGLPKLPAAIRKSAETLMGASVEPEIAVAVMRREVVAGEVRRRLSADPHLQQADARHLETVFNQYRGLEQRKLTLVKETIVHRWTALQKQRLLALTGTRLNSLGAEVKRRFTLTGERAMRLRKVVEVGRNTEGGDPFFDLRPVWMASPETVAQLFPREALFDVVIFDEASQCKFEEAMPVLTRGKRVVIAGDQQQLPPSRFFESAVVSSDEDEAESDQELFESQQANTEDLLAAALKLEVDEAYLKVHYRSRSADLIEFSNLHFYRSELQAIPGHPANTIRFAPLTLERIDGVYDKGVNSIEAERVCQIVRDLLKRADPPSIGIACFNVNQRDEILDKLDELAAADADFARRLAESRQRVGKGSFEGLFVKNLENVQGDERDHMIISTTYGPDDKGRFYRRFGPLGRAGGGRRLNVLVTRARHEVHLVTSIPAEHYRALPPVPPGQTPNGAWLLFSYLQYAEQLQEQYEMVHRILSQSGPEVRASCNVRQGVKPTSRFAEALGHTLAASQNLGSEVHWGNDGFGIDVAIRHPKRAEDVAVGLLCDWSRFEQAEDPVEWDAFRTTVHESQGWVLHRLWTPHFFRDPELKLREIRGAVEEFLAKEPPRDDLLSVPS